MGEDPQERELGATWADFGIAISEFARAEPLKFVMVVLVLALGIGFILWFLLPRVTKSCEAVYAAAVAANRKAKEDEPPLPLGTNDD